MLWQSGAQDQEGDVKKGGNRIIGSKTKKNEENPKNIKWADHYIAKESVRQKGGKISSTKYRERKVYLVSKLFR